MFVYVDVCEVVLLLGEISQNEKTMNVCASVCEHRSPGMWQNLR